MMVGLRIDVDTFRGTKYGVPNLCRVLADHDVKASFFFSVGPDNMGRHLSRLIRPRFLGKMLRSKAASLYGWDILLRGVLWPGPIIGEKLASVIGAASDAGHEMGLHAWDHYEWQVHMDAMTRDDIYNSIKRGFELMTIITGKPPTCSAVPGWRCDERVLLEKAKFHFTYNSDCRGSSIFHPVVNGKMLSQPQIPVTIPTYDEVIGRRGITDSNYNDYILTLFEPEKLNILTIHAEVEGVARHSMFQEFLEKARTSGVVFVPLGQFLSGVEQIDCGTVSACEISGREGWVSCQKQTRCPGRFPGP